MNATEMINAELKERYETSSCGTRLKMFIQLASAFGLAMLSNYSLRLN